MVTVTWRTGNERIGENTLVSNFKHWRGKCNLQPRVALRRPQLQAKNVIELPTIFAHMVSETMSTTCGLGTSTHLQVDKCENHKAQNLGTDSFGWGKSARVGEASKPKEAETTKTRTKARDTGSTHASRRRWEVGWASPQVLILGSTY